MSNYRLDHHARKGGPFSAARWTTYAGLVDQFSPAYSDFENIELKGYFSNAGRIGLTVEGRVDGIKS